MPDQKIDPAPPSPVTAPDPAASPFGPEVQAVDEPFPAPEAMAAEFDHLEGEFPGTMALTVMPVGGGPILTLGDWADGISWSTIKVPLAVAALRQDPQGLTDTATDAITASDNEAAQQLWDALGGGEAAATAVESVLREGGDGVTDVADRHKPAQQTAVDEPMAFGATDWTLHDQVRFASRLPCLPDASRVTNLMSDITASQSWGLGAFPGAQYKGGWGPDDATGAYLVRQFGLVPTGSGHLAVALAAQPDSGTYEDATAMLDSMAALLSAHMNTLGGGECRS